MKIYSRKRINDAEEEIYVESTESNEIKWAYRLKKGKIIITKYGFSKSIGEIKDNFSSERFHFSGTNC